MKIIRLVILILLFPVCGYPVSDPFPQSTDAPTVADFLTSPTNTYYCAPSTATPAGNNTTGTGSITQPWLDFRGATTGGAGTAITGGDLLYLRGGTYPVTAESGSPFSRSLNTLERDGTDGNPIVVSNYPGEIAEWSDTTSWSLTIRGDYIKLIGEKVGSAYGIKINGGMTFHEGDYPQMSGLEITSGCSNGGDLNPAMLADPLNGTSQIDPVISHNYFHDSAYAIPEERMRAIGIFVTNGLIVEYNVFEDLVELFERAGSILFKDAAQSSTVRYNKFINVVTGIVYSSQGNDFNGLDCHSNLFYDVDWAFRFASDLTNNSNPINIYENVMLSINNAMLGYENADNQDWTEHGSYYDNVVDGTCLVIALDNANSDDNRNVPDLINYNLWYDSADRNTSSTEYFMTLDFSGKGYYANAVTENNSVTYNATTQTATVADDYAGLGQGRTGGNIGGFTFSATSPVVTCQSDDTTSNDSYPFTATYTLEGARTVSSCTWSNSLGGSGSCTATGGNITGTATGLSVGDNVITIELTDSEAETGNCSFTVTRTQTAVGISGANFNGSYR